VTSQLYRGKQRQYFCSLEWAQYGRPNVWYSLCEDCTEWMHCVDALEDASNGSIEWTHWMDALNGCIVECDG
jgi:hypothetical protein